MSEAETDLRIARYMALYFLMLFVAIVLTWLTEAVWAAIVLAVVAGPLAVLVGLAFFSTVVEGVLDGTRYLIRGAPVRRPVRADRDRAGQVWVQKARVGWEATYWHCRQGDDRRGEDGIEEERTVWRPTLSGAVGIALERRRRTVNRFRPRKARLSVDEVVPDIRTTEQRQRTTSNDRDHDE